MTHDASPFEVDDFTLKVVRRQARALVGCAGLTRADQADLEQDLLQDLLARWPRFDPRRANREAFTELVVRNRSRTVLASRNADRRDWRRSGSSLDGLVPGDDDEFVALSKTLDADVFLRRTGREFDDAPQAHDLRLDVSAAVEALPPDLRRIADAVAQNRDLASAARALGMPRHAIRAALARLRLHFERHGLGHSDGCDANPPRRAVGGL